MKTGTQPADTPDVPEAKGASPVPADTPADPPADPPAGTPTKDQRPITDAEDLDTAYTDQSNMYLDSQGTLYVAGTLGSFKKRVD